MVKRRSRRVSWRCQRRYPPLAGEECAPRGQYRQSLDGILWVVAGITGGVASCATKAVCCVVSGVALAIFASPLRHRLVLLRSSTPRCADHRPGTAECSTSRPEAFPAAHPAWVPALSPRWAHRLSIFGKRTPPADLKDCHRRPRFEDHLS